MLDTDICSASMKGITRVYNRFLQYSGRLHISTVTLGELYVWALRGQASPKRKQLLLKLLKEVQILPIDETVAHKFGEVRAWQLDRGLGSPELDLLNGAVALVHNFTMVTHNQPDYDNIPGLSRDDWPCPQLSKSTHVMGRGVCLKKCAMVAKKWSGLAWHTVPNQFCPACAALTVCQCGRGVPIPLGWRAVA